MSPELTQYLRLHCRDLTFEQTVEKARIYHSTTDGTKPKKAIRFVTEPDADLNVLLINHLKSKTVAILPEMCSPELGKKSAKNIYKNKEKH